MKYYQDITLLADAEVNLGFLWQKVFQQVHLALVENKVANNKSLIAVSFPNFNEKKFPLGNKLRLFAPTENLLTQLDINKWLNRLMDYSHCTSIRGVPSNISQFSYFKRKQFKSNLEKVAKRQADYKKIEFSETLKQIKEKYDGECKLPFIMINSLSTNKNIEPVNRKKFKLFIEQKFIDKQSIGDFNCYGLSHRGIDAQSSVPWF